MNTPPTTPMKGSGGGNALLILAALVGLLILGSDGPRTKVFAAIKAIFRKDKESALSQPSPPPPPAPATDLLVGTWQGRLASGADELLTFGSLGEDEEGVMSRTVYANGKQVEGWTGKYKHWDNPLFAREDRRQIRMEWVDPALGRKEQFVVLKSVSDQTLVLTGIYDRKFVEYRRTR